MAPAIAREREAAMVQMRFPAVFMRGGTSRGLFFRRDCLPEDPAAWLWGTNIRSDERGCASAR